MNKKGVVILDKNIICVIIYFGVLTIINFLSYSILVRYLYLCAGVTKEDVKNYINEQVINPQRHLVRWLRQNAVHKKEFEIMLLICNTVIFLSLFPVLLLPINLIYNQFMIIKIVAVILPIVSFIVSFVGLQYGKKIKKNYKRCDWRSENKTYHGENMPEQIDDLDELYLESENEIHQKQWIGRYIYQVIRIIIILFFILGLVIFKN